MSIYLDNGATSHPKAPLVGEAMKNCIEMVGGSVNRRGYNALETAEETVFETRELLGHLLNFHRYENIVFTLNVTYGLNFLLKGLLQPGDHCLVSSMEHNAVMRPLTRLAARGVEFTRIMADEEGQIDPACLDRYLRKNTKVVVMNHASNVCGTILPVEEIGVACREKGLIYIVDAAQTAGALEIDYKKIKAHAIAFTGHKGLLGPQGVGGVVLGDELAQDMEPLICGGTGSLSELEEQPPYLPDKFESGTPNLPGIFGLHAALTYIARVGVNTIREKEMELAKMLLEGLGGIGQVRIAGMKGTAGRTAVVSADFTELDNAEVAYLLDKNYGIRTRCGLHCAPSAHKTLGTYPKGTVRFSPGPFNTKEDIETTLEAVRRVLKELGKRR